jgi:GABA(A) receptor-associated protein
MLKNITRVFNENKVTSFKDKHSFEKRIQESTKIIDKYPDRIPIIVQRANTDVKEIDKEKYLVPKDLTMGQFLHVIRQRIKLDPHQSIYLFVNASMVPSSMLISEIYENNKDKDNFLYVTYCMESAFG